MYTLIVATLISIGAFAQEIGDMQTGKLSYYNDIYQGRPTASGEIYDKTKISAAHKYLPLKTMIEVENLKNNKSIFVEINDRTPEGSESILELSRAAAQQLGFIEDGTAKGRIRIIQVPQPSSKKSKRFENSKAPKLQMDKLERKIENRKYKEVKNADEVTPNRVEKLMNTSNTDVNTESDIIESVEEAIGIGNTMYGVQLGAYKEKHSLNEAINLANEKGMHIKNDLFIITERSPNGNLHKLIYGYFGEELVKKKMNQVKPHFKGSFIKKFE